MRTTLWAFSSVSEILGQHITHEIAELVDQWTVLTEEITHSKHDSPKITSTHHFAFEGVSSLSGGFAAIQYVVPK